MSTMPMMQPQNPNQAAGTSMSPMSYTAPASPLAATVPVTPKIGQPTGVGASTAGTPFGGAATTMPTVGAPISISSGISTADGSNTMTGDFKDSYGSGTGTALAGVLGNLGTATDAAVQATNQGILTAAGMQQANLTAGQAAAGISRDSSSASLQNADFASQVNQTIASTDAGMQLNEENTLISALQSEGQEHGHDSSWTDSIGDVFGLLNSGGSAAQAGNSNNSNNSNNSSGSGGISPIISMLAML